MWGDWLTRFNSMLLHHFYFYRDPSRPPWQERLLVFLAVSGAYHPSNLMVGFSRVEQLPRQTSHTVPQNLHHRTPGWSLLIPVRPGLASGYGENRGRYDLLSRTYQKRRLSVRDCHRRRRS